MSRTCGVTFWNWKPLVYVTGASVILGACACPALRCPGDIPAVDICAGGCIPPYCPWGVYAKDRGTGGTVTGGVLAPVPWFAIARPKKGGYQIQREASLPTQSGRIKLAPLPCKDIITLCCFCYFLSRAATQAHAHAATPTRVTHARVPVPIDSARPQRAHMHRDRHIVSHSMHTQTLPHGHNAVAAVGHECPYTGASIVPSKSRQN